MTNLNDEQLVVRYLAGDESAFETLVERYLPLVYGLSRQYSGDEDKAADIAQEIFIKVWRHIKKFDPARSFRSWLFIIAKNTALDWLKKKEELPFSSFETEDGQNDLWGSIVDPRPSPSAAADNKILAEKISEHFIELPEQYRSVISMRFNEGLTFKEISEKLKKPLNTVKSHYRRALQLLKRFTEIE